MATSITLDTGAGTGASSVLTGDDVKGLIKVTTGLTPAASAVIFAFNFGRGFARVPLIQVVPANLVTAILGAAMTYVDNADTTTALWKMRSPATPLTALIEFAWYYHLIGLVP